MKTWPANLHQDSAATLAYIQAQYAAVGIGRWAVLRQATGQFMGWAGLKLVANPVNGQRDFYDLGYRYLPRSWGQGCGHEAARARLAALKGCGCPASAPTPTCATLARAASWRKSGCKRATNL